MRTLLFVTSAVVLGIFLGAGVAVLKVRSVPWNRQLNEGIDANPAARHEAAPKAVIEPTSHDFGAVEGGVAISRDFVVSNAGDAPLTLSDGGISSDDLATKFERSQLPPGASAKVTLTWTPRHKPGQIYQNVQILTNDPARARIVLKLSANVTMAMQLSRQELSFGRLTHGQSATAQTLLLGYLQETLKIEGQQWADDAIAQYFEAATRPLSAEELKTSGARCGVEISATVKPGLPPGSFRQALVLKTNLASSPTVVLPMKGMIDSDIMVGSGRGWDPDSGILTLGTVARESGLKRGLTLLVRGPLRREVRVKSVHATPSLVKVDVGQGREINNGAVIEIPLTIEIPPDSPPAIHLGSKHGKLGEIVLETTHPQVPILRIRLSFAIEG